MSKFVCSNGTVSFLGSFISSMDITNIFIDILAEAVPYKLMGTEGNYLTNQPGTKSWSATFESAFDTALGVDLDDTVGVIATVILNTVDGKAYTGKGIITTASISAPVADYATVSWALVGTSSINEI